MNLSWLLLLHCWKSTAGSRGLKNFHPVPNLTYLSKFIERVVVVRLNQHLTKNGLYEVMQSAYKKTPHWNSSVQSTKWSSYGNRHIWWCRRHPAWFICSIWYYRPYFTAATTAWVRNQRCCIRLVQILFQPAEATRCYQCHTIITSKSVFQSASGISTWPNTIHPVRTTGRNNTEISAKSPSLCWWQTAVHGIQAKQCGIITHSHQQHPKLCQLHQVRDDG